MFQYTFVSAMSIKQYYIFEKSSCRPPATRGVLEINSYSTDPIMRQLPVGKYTFESVKVHKIY